MTPVEELARWRQWAQDMAGSSYAVGEQWNDDDLRYLVIFEQEQRISRVLGALRIGPLSFAQEVAVAETK